MAAILNQFQESREIASELYCLCSTAVKRLSMREKFHSEEFLLFLTFFLNLKFAGYPCFSVVLAGSLHFPKEKYFCLYYLFRPF